MVAYSINLMYFRVHANHIRRIFYCFQRMMHFPDSLNEWMNGQCISNDCSIIIPTDTSMIEMKYCTFFTYISMPKRHITIWFLPNNKETKKEMSVSFKAIHNWTKVLRENTKQHKRIKTIVQNWWKLVDFIFTTRSVIGNSHEYPNNPDVCVARCVINSIQTLLCKTLGFAK